MAHTCYIGIDNGVSGQIALLMDSSVNLFRTPVKSEYNYTKAKQKVTRVQWDELMDILNLAPEDTLVVLERPMVNPLRFKASTSALRCLEATLIAVEKKNFARMYCDSKEWQKAMLPSGLEGIELKKASLDIGKRLFPKLEWKGFKDADGLLMAEYVRRRGF